MMDRRNTSPNQLADMWEVVRSNFLKPRTWTSPVALITPELTERPLLGDDVRGLMFREEGATGVADVLLLAQKNAVDETEYAQIVTAPVALGGGAIPAYVARVIGGTQLAASLNTAAIMAAINAARAAGGGHVSIAGVGTIWLDDNVTSGTCIKLDDTYSDIIIEGMGKRATRLKVKDGANAQVMAFNGSTRCVARNFTLDGNHLNQSLSGFHGFSVSGTDNRLEHLYVYDFYGYGVAVAQGSSGVTAVVHGLKLYDVEVEHTGADGIDFKDNLVTNTPSFLDTIKVSDYDFREGGDKAGIDLRGPVLCTGIYVLSPAGTSSSAFRFRPGAEGSQLVNFKLVGGGGGTLPFGIEFGGIGNHVSNGLITGFSPGVGMNHTGTAGDTLAVGVRVVGCADGVNHSDSDGPFKLVGCTFDGCGNCVVVEGSGNDLHATDCDLVTSTRGYWITSGAHTRIRGGRLVGTFTQAFRHDAGADDTIVDGLDFSTIVAGTITKNGTNLVLRNCPGHSMPIFVSVPTDRTDADVDTAQSVFDAANDTVTLIANTLYELKAVYHITSTGTTSANLATLFAGTATYTSLGFSQISNNPATETRGATVGSWAEAASPGVNATQTVAAARFHTIVLDGIIRVNAAGTFIPQYKFSAAPGATPIVHADSYLRLTPLGVGAMVASGTTFA